MEISEPIEQLNRQLIDLFGIDTITGQPIWRIVYSEDQLEKRMGDWEDYTTNGLYIRTIREVREVKKYSQWIQNKYVMERLTAVPEMHLEELGVKISYEPMWVFEDKDGNALPPKLEVCQIVIDSVYAATDQNPRGRMVKYVDEMATNPKEVTEKRIQALMLDIWGNETREIDSVRAHQGVILPSSYFGDKDKK